MSPSAAAGAVSPLQNSEVTVSVYPDGSAFISVGLGPRRSAMAVHHIAQVRELHQQLTEALEGYDAR